MRVHISFDICIQKTWFLWTLGGVRNPNTVNGVRKSRFVVATLRQWQHGQLGKPLSNIIIRRPNSQSCSKQRWWCDRPLPPGQDGAAPLNPVRYGSVKPTQTRQKRFHLNNRYKHFCFRGNNRLPLLSFLISKYTHIYILEWYNCHYVGSAHCGQMTAPGRMKFGM